MNTAWIKGLFGLSVLLTGTLMMTLSVQAQPAPDLDPPPRAVDVSGLFSLPYPTGWTVSLDRSNNILTLSEEANPNTPNQIRFTAIVIEAVPNDFETLQADLDQQGLIPEGLQFTAERYSGLPSWIAQGQALTQSGFYSAYVILQAGSNRVILTEAIFPQARLTEAAPIVTNLLQNIETLPLNVINRDNTLRVNLPAGWVSADGLTALYAAPNESDLRRIAQNQAPSQIAISLRYATSSGTLEQFLLSPTALLQAEGSFTFNNERALIYFRRDNTINSYELLFVQPRATGTFLELRALSSNRAYLLDQLETLSAIFAGLHLQ